MGIIPKLIKGLSPDSKRKKLDAAKKRRAVLAVLKVDLREMPKTFDSDQDSDDDEVTVMVRHRETTVAEIMAELRGNPLIQRKKEKQVGAIRLEFGLGEEVQTIKEGSANAELYQLKLFNGLKAAEGYSQGIMRAKMCGPKKAKQDMGGSPQKRSKVQ